MKAELEKIRLADRTEAILRSDRQEICLTRRPTERPASDLSLLPNNSEVQ